MNRMIVVPIALASLLLIIPIPTHAAPEITQDLAFIDNRPSGDIFGIPGLRLNLTVSATDTLGSGALAAGSSSAVPSNLSFPFAQPVNVPLNAVFPIIGGAEFTRILPLTGIGQFPDVTGTYTFTVTNSSLQSTSSTSHILDKTEVIPIPINLAFSDQSTTPVFTFTDPDPSPEVSGVNRRYQLNIFDASKTSIFESDVLPTASFAVPFGILEAGKTYYFRANSLDFDPSELIGGVEPLIHSRVENRAIEYATFQPVPEPATMFLLGSGLLGLAGYGRKKFFKK